MNRSGASWVVPVVLAVAGLGALLAIGAPNMNDDPLDPRSDARLGTSAVVALAEDLGAEVEIVDRLPGPGGDTDILLMFDDSLAAGQHDQLQRWVEAGHTLVVADPSSTFTPPLARPFRDVAASAGRLPGSRQCDIGALDQIDVEGIEIGGSEASYEVPAGADSCLGDGVAAYIVATAAGGGTVVAVGGHGMFVNVALDEGENAPVVAALVAPHADVHLAVLRPGPIAGSGDDTLFDLISPNVRRALVQLLVAFVVYVLWRSRRLGAPVTEPQPVAVAGSELVAAVGGLLDRSGSPEHAAELLRADLHRFLAERLGVPPDTDAHVLAAVAAERAGADQARIAWALGPWPVADDRQLVTLAQTIDAIRQEVLTHV